MSQSATVMHVTHRKCGREISAVPRTMGLPAHTHAPKPRLISLELVWTGNKTCLHTSAPQSSTAIVYKRSLHVRTGSQAPLSPATLLRKKGSIQASKQANEGSPESCCFSAHQFLSQDPRRVLPQMLSQSFGRQSG